MLWQIGLGVPEIDVPELLPNMQTDGAEGSLGG